MIDKPVYSAFAGHHLLDELMRRHSDALILTGAETDVCVLSTAFGAIDRGYRVITAEDAVCSSSDHGHDSLLALFAQCFSEDRGRQFANDSNCMGDRVKHSRCPFVSADLRRKRCLHASRLSFAHFLNAALPERKKNGRSILAPSTWEAGGAGR